MGNKKEIRNRLRRLIIIFAAIIVPGIVKIIDSNAFAHVKDVDLALFFVSGVATGAFIVLLRIYFQFKNEEE